MRSLNFLVVFSISLFIRLYQASSSVFDFSGIPEFNLKEHERPFIIYSSSSSEISKIGEDALRTVSPVSKSSDTKISAIEKPSKASRNISDVSASAAVRPKRKKTESVHTADKTIEQIIDEEVASSGFKTEKRLSQLRNTLRLISLNDYRNFMDDQVNFRNVFGANYGSFKKEKDSPIFLYRYFIIFGAYNLIAILSTTKVIFSESNYSAFNYLLESKPLSEVLKVFLWHGSHNFTDESREMVRSALLARCTESSRISKSMVKLIGSFSFAYQLRVFIDAPESQEMFDRIVNVSATIESLSCTPVIIRTIVKDNPEYYRNTSQENKFKVLQLFLFVDDPELLVYILNLDHSMLFYVNEPTCSNYPNEESNIVIEAIRYRALKCLDFLVGTFPELAVTSTDKLDSPLNYLIKRSFSKLCFEVFEKHGFDANYVTKIDEKDLNLLQASFYANNGEAFMYYSSKVGFEATNNMIRSVWTSSETILEKIFQKFNARCISHVVTLLGIDVNSIFHYNGFEGNAIIFMDVSSRICNDPESIGIDISAPVYRLDPSTGLKYQITL